MVLWQVYPLNSHHPHTPVAANLHTHTHTKPQWIHPLANTLCNTVSSRQWMRERDSHTCTCYTFSLPYMQYYRARKVKNLQVNTFANFTVLPPSTKSFPEIGVQRGVWQFRSIFHPRKSPIVCKVSVCTVCKWFVVYSENGLHRK